MAAVAAAADHRRVAAVQINLAENNKWKHFWPLSKHTSDKAAVNIVKFRNAPISSPSLPPSMLADVFHRFVYISFRLLLFSRKSCVSPVRKMTVG